MDDKSFDIRVPKRWVRVAMIVGVTALIVAPLTAIASHSFNDVPNTNTFHSDIEWMKDSGVTKGCNPPDNSQYCPDDNVTRGQMAAFMNRFAGYIGAEDGTPAQADNATTADDADTLDGLDSSDFLGPDQLAVTSAEGYDFFTAGFNITLAAAGTPIVETTIATPADGHLLTVGHAAVGNSGTSGSLYTIWIEIDDGTCGIAGSVPDTSVPGATTYTRAGTADDYSAGVNGVAAVSAGTHTVTLCGANSGGDGDAFNGSIVAQFLSDASTSVVTSGNGGSGSGPDS